MVVGLVLEADEPVLGLSVDLHRNHDGAGVDLIGNIQILQLTLCAKALHAHQCDIHEAGKLVAPACIDLRSVSLVHIEGCLDGCGICALIEGNIRKLRCKCGMTAVIGPVGIQHADLRHGRITVLFSSEIVLDMLEILEGHGKAEGIVKCL